MSRGPPRGLPEFPLGDAVAREAKRDQDRIPSSAGFRERELDKGTFEAVDAHVRTARRSDGPTAADVVLAGTGELNIPLLQGCAKIDFILWHIAPRSATVADAEAGVDAELVHRCIQMIQYNASVLVFPAKAGTHVCHGHRPSPV